MATDVVSFRPLLLGLWACALVFTVCACEPKSNATDRSELTIAAGNAELKKLEALDTELQKQGVWLRFGSVTSITLDVTILQTKTQATAKKARSQLQSLQEKLTEYIKQVELIFELARRPGVLLAEDKALRENHAYAKTLLLKIERALP